MELSGKEVQFSHMDGEVASTIWLTLDEFRQLIAGKFGGKQVVPHGDVYFAELFKGISPNKTL